MKNHDRSSSHAVFDIKLHIVFVTKCRRKTLTPEVLDYLRNAFADCLAAWRCSLVEFGGAHEVDLLTIWVSSTASPCSGIVRTSLAASAARHWRPCALMSMRKEPQNTLARPQQKPKPNRPLDPLLSGRLRLDVAAQRDRTGKGNARTLFNILIGNSDAHLKNLSLLATKGGYQLAPHYDLLATSAWNRPELALAGEPTWPNIPMSFQVGDATTYPQLTSEHLHTFAHQLGLAPSAAAREIRRMTGKIEALANEVKAEFEARTDVPLDARASQLRMILAIIHIPISTMARQLKD